MAACPAATTCGRRGCGRWRGPCRRGRTRPRRPLPPTRSPSTTAREGSSTSSSCHRTSTFCTPRRRRTSRYPSRAAMVAVLAVLFG
uniref:Uncharacterized protein n=1 Tax=Oryza punctata TaxID=4537 RepID=A0A0E0KHJ1_ORYPU